MAKVHFKKNILTLSGEAVTGSFAETLKEDDVVDITIGLGGVVTCTITSADHKPRHPALVDVLEQATPDMSKVAKLLAQFIGDDEYEEEYEDFCEGLICGATGCTEGEAADFLSDMPTNVIRDRLEFMWRQAQREGK